MKTASGVKKKDKTIRKLKKTFRADIEGIGTIEEEEVDEEEDESE